MSKEVFFFVEGETEEAFVKEILGPHLQTRSIYYRGPIKTAIRHKGEAIHRGGTVRYSPFRRDLEHIMRQHRGKRFVFTTLIDLYGLPGDFPGKHEAGNCPSGHEKAEVIETSLKEELNDYRFLPHLLVHEFEALVLANPESLLTPYPHQEEEVKKLKKDIGRFSNPEEINDGMETHPSKRIQRVLKPRGIRYDKVTGGTLAVLATGLATIRERCPRFNRWLTALENLS